MTVGRVVSHVARVVELIVEITGARNNYFPGQCPYSYSFVGPSRAWQWVRVGCHSFKMSRRGLIPVVLAVGFGVANGRPRNKKNIVRRLTYSHRLRYIQPCVSRFTGRETQTREVSLLCLTQAKMLTKPHLELSRPPTLDRALLKFLLVAKGESASTADPGSVGKNMTSECVENGDKSRSKTRWPFGRQGN